MQIKQHLNFTPKCGTKLDGSPNILLVNPWIHDFAAYDFWAKPLGLMILASILRAYGAEVSYIDCLERHHPLSKIGPSTYRCGRGPYIKTPIHKPKALEDIPRNYCRYGILPNWFEYDLKSVYSPNVILVSSVMTYWYPGTKETIEVIRRVHPNVPVILGGVYPSLCKSHAIENSGADYVVSGPGENSIVPLITEFTGWQPQSELNCHISDIYPRPLFELQRKIDYIPILTGKGCPYSCSYCASSFLQPNIVRKSNEAVFSEILYWNKHYKVSEFIFYDDALLVDSEHHIAPVLEKIIKSNIKVVFHTPNAVHIREINKKVAKLMFKSGFKTIRLGLESGNFGDRQQIDSKVESGEFQQAAKYLIEAGFKENQIGVYLLVGLPGQEIGEIEKSINVVKKIKLHPILAYYSPIPHTSQFLLAYSCIPNRTF